MTLDLTRRYSLLDELDARQDEVLQRLETLNGEIEGLLKQFGGKAPLRACIEVSAIDSAACS